MKPASFDYYAPTSVDEALALLKSHRDARLLAGGQSLLPMMNFRLATPSVIVDLNRIPGLAYIERKDGIVRIGAQQPLHERSHQCRPLLRYQQEVLHER